MHAELPFREAGIKESPLYDLAKKMLGVEAAESLDRPLAKSLQEAQDDANKDCPLEGSGGTWSGERGNSDWIADDSKEPGLCNPDGASWKEIKERYGFEKIPFRDGEPDFSEISKGTVEIDEFTPSRAKNFTQADEKLAEEKGCSPKEVRAWRRENGYTWHECSDCKTMQKVPGTVHSNVSHSGGISVAKSAEAS